MNISNPHFFVELGDWYAVVYISDEEHQKRLKYIDSLGKQKDKEDNQEYWRTIQGHPNPYDKEFYDYVEAHKNIKFSSDPKVAMEEMRQIKYKIYVYSKEEDRKMFPCEKSNGRLILELVSSILENFFL